MSVKAFHVTSAETAIGVAHADQVTASRPATASQQF